MNKSYLRIHILPFLFLMLLIESCGTVKKKNRHSDASKQRAVIVGASEPKIRIRRKSKKEGATLSVTSNIINTALTYSGTRYKFGGTTKNGMDCSGLLYASFSKHKVSLPRVSYRMAEEGRRVHINKVIKGDLLFFKTKKNGNRINHVGMVVAVENNEIKFIHSSSSRGVIVSSLREGYWKSVFVKATRVL